MELYRECIGSGAAVLLIHGALSDHTFFSGVAEYLSKSCKVISYDRKGYGENPLDCQADYSLAAQAECLSGADEFYCRAWVCSRA